LDNCFNRLKEHGLGINFDSESSTHTHSLANKLKLTIDELIARQNLIASKDKMIDEIYSEKQKLKINLELLQHTVSCMQEANKDHSLSIEHLKSKVQQKKSKLSDLTKAHQSLSANYDKLKD